MDIKVRVRFITKYDEYSVPLSPFSIPTKLGRYGLSEIINHLLDLHDSQPFDFTINGKLIRVSLSKFISLYNISTEDIITIEYYPAISINDESQSIELPSWIGCFSCNHNNDILNDIIISGCYDGQIHFNDINNLNTISTIIAHDDPIRDIKTFSIDNNNSIQYIATASKDMSIKCWIVDKDNIQNDKPIETKKRKKTIKTTNDMDIDESKVVTYNMKQVGVLNGHSNSVESLAYWNDKDILLSGDWNGTIMGWNVAAMEDNNKAKKGNSNNNDIIDLKPVFSIRAHVQPISGMYQNENHLFTSSWDHSLKQWDLEKQDCINTYAGSKVITSLHVGSIERNLIATSHPDGRVRIWDQRLNSESGTVGTFSSKDGKDWVSQVRWHPTSGNIFASSDYEGTVKVWDLRSNVPLGTSDAHQGKALCVDWILVDDVVKVISGGSDCIIKSTAVGSF